MNTKLLNPTLFLSPRGAIERKVFLNAGIVLFFVQSGLFAAFLLLNMYLESRGLDPSPLAAATWTFFILLMYPYFCIYKKWYANLNINLILLLPILALSFLSVIFALPIAVEVMVLIAIIDVPDLAIFYFMQQAVMLISVAIIAFSGAMIITYLSSRITRRDCLVSN